MYVQCPECNLHYDDSYQSPDCGDAAAVDHRAFAEKPVTVANHHAREARQRRAATPRNVAAPSDDESPTPTSSNA